MTAATAVVAVTAMSDVVGNPKPTIYTPSMMQQCEPLCVAQLVVNVSVGVLSQLSFASPAEEFKEEGET